MKVLVTGGSGRLGSAIAPYLAEKYDVTVLDLVPPVDGGPAFIQADILDPQAMDSSISGFDAVAHLAAVPYLLRDDPEKTFRVNVMGTYNVLQACARNGVGKFVFASSDSTIGIVHGRRGLRPDYLPVDESHPLRPEEAYGLSKVVGEETCRAYSRSHGINVTILRPCWVWNYRDKPEGYRKAIEEPERRQHGLWSYIHVLDVARAFDLGLKAEWPSGCEEFLLAADDTTSTLPTRELIARFFPGFEDIRVQFEGRESLISTAKAKRMLGWRPEHDWAELVQI